MYFCSRLAPTAFLGTLSLLCSAASACRYCVGYNWELTATRRRAASSQASRAARVLELAARHTGRESAVRADPSTTMPYPMGKVVGGGSSVNGALALHARREDYDEWAALGNPYWSWEQVAPTIAAIDRDDPHRRGLPRYVPNADDLTPLQEAFGRACASRGFAEVSAGASVRDGYCAIPKNVLDRRKVSAADLYLAPARDRPNLTILPHCLVDRLSIGVDGCAHSVEVVHAGARRRFSAGRFVLAAGAVHSPGILMRSGVGPLESLEALRIQPRLPLPGVGRNLVDHASVSLWGVPRRGSWCDGEPVHQLMLEQTHRQGALRRDLQLFMLGAVPVDDFSDLRSFVGNDVAMGITVVLATPASRGRIELASDDPGTPPSIHLNCLDDAQDLERMLHGVRMAWRLLQGSPLRECMDRPVLWSDAIVDSDQLLREAVLTLVNGAWHPVGSLRMGPSDDPMAVVDQVGTLRGCANVSVADASIMPSIPGVPTNLTCLLIAERISSAIRTGARSWC